MKENILFIVTTPPITSCLHKEVNLKNLNNTYEILNILLINKYNIDSINKICNLQIQENIYKEYKIYYGCINEEESVNELIYYHMQDYWQNILKENFEENLMKEIYEICQYIYIKKLSPKIRIIIKGYDDKISSGNFFIFQEKKYKITKIEIEIKNNKVSTFIFASLIDDLPKFSLENAYQKENSSLIEPLMITNKDLMIIEETSRLITNKITFI